MNTSTPRSIAAAAGALILTGVCSLASAQPDSGILPILFQTGFDAPAYVAGPLVGQDKWTGLPEFPARLAANVQKVGPDGSLGVRITPGTYLRSSCEWSHNVSYQMTTALPVLRFEWDAMLHSSKMPSDIWQTAIYDSKGTMLCALQITPAGAAINTEVPVPRRDFTPVPMNTWNHFEMRLNFTAATADIIMNGTPLTPAPVPAPALTPDTRIGSIGYAVMNPGFDVTDLDNINIMTMSYYCAPNCDGSITPPVLNVLDFQCFEKSFVQALSLPPELQVTSYANFDASTTPPVLNVQDYIAFLNAFARGCR